MKNIFRYSLILFIIILSTLCVFASDDTSYEEKANYLQSIDLFNGVNDNFELDKQATRLDITIMALRISGREESLSYATYYHPFTDVPEWASNYVGCAYRYELMTGISNNKYGAKNTASAKDYTTLMLRILGHSDKNGDFSWNNSLEYALEIGLINQNEYDSLQGSTFDRGDMVMLSYNTVKKLTMFLYTEENLDKLVASTDPSSEVTAFRNKSNSRRNGLEKHSFKYLDVYYPNTDDAKACLELLKPHADKVYMMLTDLYGVQAKAEIHLIDVNIGKGLREGDIRERENVSFIWLDKGNDGGGNNLEEFIHEINHNFFSAVNGNGTNEMWIDEANAKLIPSLYLTHNYHDPVSQISFRALSGYKRDMSLTDMTFSKADSILEKARAWDGANDERKIAQKYGLYYWMKIFNTSEPDEFKYYLRNLGNGDVIQATERLTSKNAEETTKWLKQ